jgi:protein tyrosine/serine phosphatase
MGHQKRTLLTCLMAAAVALSPVIGTAADTSSSPTSVRAAASRISIDNFGEINANYYRGAQPEGRDYHDLATLGVKTVIDLQADGKPGEEQLVTAAGMKFHRIPMTTRVAPTEEQLSHFMKLVNDPANQPVYVHCAGGRHRTGVMTEVYRMTHDRWDAAQAFKEMKDYKFGADFLHPEFKKFVYAYHVEPASAPPAVLATGVITSEAAGAR